jgi:hypothetical protein
VPPLLSVSVDLDEIACYYDIHGLEHRQEAASRLIWTHAVPRFIDLFERWHIQATFFVVGSSLDAEQGIPGIERLAAAGHEIANHSFHHYYDLLRRGQAQRQDEIRRGTAAIEQVTGSAPKGFRAPGYNVDDALLTLLRNEGYAYDSSVLPCPPYFVAKAAVMLGMRARGRQSKSILGPKEVLLAPTEPYWVGQSFWRRHARRGLGLLPRFHRRSKAPEPSHEPGPSPLVELPIGVVPALRVPFIGTTLSLAGRQTASMLARAMLVRRFVGLEFHGVDLLDQKDGLTALAAHQPDLRVPLDRKLATLEAVLDIFNREGAAAVTCLTAAQRFARGQ